MLANASQQLLNFDLLPSLRRQMFMPRMSWEVRIADWLGHDSLLMGFVGGFEWLTISMDAKLPTVRFPTGFWSLNFKGEYLKKISASPKTHDAKMMFCLCLLKWDLKKRGCQLWTEPVSFNSWMILREILHVSPVMWSAMDIYFELRALKCYAFFGCEKVHESEP